MVEVVLMSAWLLCKTKAACKQSPTRSVDGVSATGMHKIMPLTAADGCAPLRYATAHMQHCLTSLGSAEVSLIPQIPQLHMCQM